MTMHSGFLNWLLLMVLSLVFLPTTCQSDRTFFVLVSEAADEASRRVKTLSRELKFAEMTENARRREIMDARRLAFRRTLLESAALLRDLVNFRLIAQAACSDTWRTATVVVKALSSTTTIDSAAILFWCLSQNSTVYAPTQVVDRLVHVENALRALPAWDAFVECVVHENGNALISALPEKIKSILGDHPSNLPRISESPAFLEASAASSLATRTHADLVLLQGIVEKRTDWKMSYGPQSVLKALDGKCFDARSVGKVGALELQEICLFRYVRFRTFTSVVDQLVENTSGFVLTYYDARYFNSCKDKSGKPHTTFLKLICADDGHERLVSARTGGTCGVTIVFQTLLVCNLQ